MEKLKILSEFQSVKEYQNFMAGITKEKDVKTRIKDLMRMRKNGITKTSDSIEFEVQRVRRNNKKKNEKRRQQQNAILGEAAAELNLTLAHSPISIKSEDMGTCGSAAQSPITKLDFGVPSSPRHQEEKVCLYLFLTRFGTLKYPISLTNFCGVPQFQVLSLHASFVN